MGQNTPPTRRPCVTRHSAQINLNAAATAMTVIARLTHGPQSIAPAMTVIAKIGKNVFRPSVWSLKKKRAIDAPSLTMPTLSNLF
jgi:hypothetical protein